jgi:3-oxoacyl-[acyl-carrier protein] reductase
VARHSSSPGGAGEHRAGGRPLTVVTGAASGIGRAAALRLAGRGDVVAAVDLNEAGLAQLAADIRADGGETVVRAADVLDLGALEAFCGEVAATHGPVRYAFANAGVDRRVPMLEMSRNDWEVVLQTNVTGAFNLCRAVLPGMLGGGGGAIVLMASDFAIAGLRGQANYTAAKTATYSLAKSLAIEFARSGVRVNAVGPGPIDTALLRAGRTGERWEEALRMFRARVPMGRLGSPDEAAGTVDFLLSDRSSYVTGQLLQPNGGQVMW